MSQIDYSDLLDTRRDPMAFVDDLYAGRAQAPSLYAQNIALGYLDTIGKNDASSLRQAVQMAENAGNARQQEGLRRMEQSERDMAAQAQQMQAQKYAEEGNARNMLLAKSNEIAGKINDIYSSYDYSQKPREYTNALNELTRQKAEIDAQLEQSTEAVRSNPMHQGTTLVNPVTASKTPITSIPSEIEGERDAAYRFLGEKFSKIKESDLDKTTPDILYDALKEELTGIAMQREEFNDIYQKQFNYYKEPHNRKAETLKRNLGVSLDTQNYEIKKLENQIALAEILAKAKDLENAKEMMRSLGIIENSLGWNFGVKNHGNVALQFLGTAAQKLQAQQPAEQPKVTQRKIGSDD
jgi:hypothetical protein